MRTTAFILAMALSAGALRAQDTPADREFTFAARLLERGESGLAGEAFEQFIAKFADDPRIGDAHYYLAVIARRAGDPDAAERHLASVRSAKHVTEAALRVLRGQVHLDRGRGPEAIRELEGVRGEDLPDDGARAAWQYLLGAAYRAAGNPTGAAERFAAAAKLDTPARAAALLELGKTRVELKDPEGAIAALTESLSGNPAPELAAEARALGADLAYNLGQHDRAAELYKQVIAHHQSTPEFGPAVVGVLRAMFAGGRYTEVVAQHDSTRKLIPADRTPESQYLVGASHVQLKQYDKAADYFLAFYRQTGGEHPLANEVAYHYALCFFHQDLDAFEKWVASFEDELPKMARGEELQFLRAQAAISRDKPRDAIRFLTPVIERTDGAHAKDALSQRAALQEQIGEPGKAADDYALFVERFPDDPGAADAGRRAIDLAFRAGQFERVTALAGAWLARKGAAAGSSEVRLKLALALLKLDRNAPSLQALEAMLADNPPPPLAAQAHYWRGVLLAAAPQGDGQAIASLRQAVAGPLPEEQKAAAIALIAQQHVKGGREREALEAYEELRALRSPDKFDPSVAVWVGRGLAAAGRDEPALLWLTPVARRSDAPEAVKAEALYQMGQALLRLGRFKQAGDAFTHLVALSRGYEDQGRLGLADAMLALGNRDEALSGYDGLINAQGSAIAARALVHSALLRLEAPGGDARARDEARKRLNRIVILYDVPELDGLVGRALVLLGLMDAEAGQKEGARKQFESVVARQPPSAWREAASAELLILEGNLGGAAALLRKIHKDTGDAVLKAHAERRLGAIGERP